MEKPQEIKAPGLRYQRGKPLWRATKSAIRDGYPVKSVNLSIYVDRPDALKNRCDRLQAEMLAWVAGRRGDEVRFDGTFRRLFENYQTDKESPYRKLKPSTVKPYDVYLRMMIAEIGERRISACDGRDVKRWFDAWSDTDGKTTLAKARMAIAVLYAALSFGVQCRFAGCADLLVIIKTIKFPAPQPRTEAPSWKQVVDLRKAAHAHGHPLAALAYAIQFDGTTRQWDVIGQWIPLSDPRPSALIDRGMKWIGPTWANIDANLIFRFKPGKTEKTTGKEIALDLRALPMVMEEFQRLREKPTGPLIVNPNTGLPYRQIAWQKVWRAAAKLAGLPTSIWNRDLRAGGITEGREAGAATDDLAKVAGHSSKQTTARVYDRATLEAQRRVSQSRATSRAKKPK